MLLSVAHEWCDLNLKGYKPNSGWYIDTSPTMAYLLKRSGLDNMVIKKTHPSVNEHLAREKTLEFRWRQHWDHLHTTEILSHVMPFYK